ncbi:MAG: hypothetical protein QM770_17995 [Tepidisphaeraceae bacterium]
MTLEELEQVLAELTDDDVQAFGAPPATEGELEAAEGLMECPFHPQHRELLLRYATLGLQVREGIYTPRKSRVINGADIEPTLVVPGPGDMEELKDKLKVLSINDIDPNQMPILYCGSNWLFHSDVNGKISEIYDHRPTDEDCEQDLFALVAHRAKSFRKHVDEKLRKK